MQVWNVLLFTGYTFGAHLIKTYCSQNCSMQLHEDTLAMSFIVRVFLKTIFIYPTPINSLKTFLSLFSNSEAVTKSYFLKQGVLLFWVFNTVAGWRLAMLVKSNSSTGILQGLSLHVQNKYMVEQLFVEQLLMDAFPGHILESCLIRRSQINFWKFLQKTKILIVK